MRGISLLSLLIVTLALPGGGKAQEGGDNVRAKLVEAIGAPEDQQVEIIEALTETGDPFVGTFVLAWRRGEVYLVESGGKEIPILLENADSKEPSQALRLIDGKPLTDDSGEPVKLLAKDLTSAPTTSELRKQIKRTLDLIALSDPDPSVRADASLKLGLSQRPEYLEVLEKKLAAESDEDVIKKLREAVAISKIANGTPEEVRAAVVELGELRSIPGVDFIKGIQTAQNELPEGERDAELISAVEKSLAQLESYMTWVDRFGTFFRGLSLGSVLLIVSLGLAITFGLMGVINMAHGELIAVGGYTAYLVEKYTVSAFGPEALQWYFLIAIPTSFFAAALVGLILERGVIQFLYKRPLESLLATWGVSLVLEQLFRLFFGAANVQVNSPDWLQGSLSISDVSMGYNRIFVIAFAAIVVIGTWQLMTRTSLGLCIRAVMQNRDMASCMGVKAARIRMLTFAFGSGLAGLAGCFLSQLGNVGPTMGQNYTIDSFMVVVSGGVGNMLGTVYASLGIGMADQALQPSLGPVMGKVCVLFVIILFLQWRPQGLFAARSRSLD